MQYFSDDVSLQSLQFCSVQFFTISECRPHIAFDHNTCCLFASFFALTDFSRYHDLSQCDHVIYRYIDIYM